MCWKEDLSPFENKIVARDQTKISRIGTRKPRWIAPFLTYHGVPERNRRVRFWMADSIGVCRTSVVVLSLIHI